ncbi:gluconokinase [Lacibacterium aquatile]|uniref:Gluconokinase n=1 Tax=Lacibacterium aquatile TaxID=1168082 RepID=A0ABW5DL31_9PROT
MIALTEKEFKGILIIMGVCGCGKSRVGGDLAAKLGVRFIEGDDFHPAANRAKMAAGQPLDDEDRWPWLDRLAGELASAVEAGQGAVLACSSLKRRYRDRLRSGAGQAVFVHLDGARAVIAERLGSRQGHFMAPSLLDSQLAALEPLQADEAHVIVRVEDPVEIAVAGLVARFGGDNEAAIKTA